MSEENLDPTQQYFLQMLKDAYNQGRSDAIATIEHSLEAVAHSPVLDGDKRVGFSHAILLVSDTYEILGLERPS